MRTRASLTVCAAALYIAFTALAGEAEPKPDSKAPAAKTAVAEARRLLQKMIDGDDLAAKAAAAEMTRLGKPAVPVAIEGTKHNVARVRYWCVSVLSGIGEERGYEAVRRCLQDRDHLVRAVAVWHIQPWWDRPGVPTLVLSKVNDRSDFVSGWAIKTLVSKKHTDAVPRLKRLLKSENENLRHDVLTGLTRLMGREALPLLKTMAGEDKSALVRDGAMRCTTLIEPPVPEVAEVLFLGLRDQDEAVRETAAKLLRKGFNRFFQYNHRRSPITQMPAIRRWEAWYEENRKKLKWSRERSRFELPAEEDVPEITPEKDKE